MSRSLRLEFAGALYHVSARGNAREDMFRDDGDRATFLDLLGREIAQQRWRLYAYCLMGSHYHLLIDTTEPNLTRGVHNGSIRSTSSASSDATGG
jgi:REP element-mobilizing transposase RayT